MRPGLTVGLFTPNCTSATCLAGLAAIAKGKGNLERAAWLFGATQAFLESLGTDLEATDPDRYDREVVTGHQTKFEHNMATVRAMLGNKAFEQAWATGQTISLEQVVAFALRSESATP